MDGLTVVVWSPVVHRGAGRRRHAEELATAREGFAAMTVGQEAEVANAVEAGWENVEQEAADEFRSRKGHGLAT